MCVCINGENKRLEEKNVRKFYWTHICLPKQRNVNNFGVPNQL